MDRLLGLRLDYSSWRTFRDAWFPLVRDYNQVVDYAFRVEPRRKEKVSLDLWMTHPRKGVSRAIRIKSLEEIDLPEIYAFLRDMGGRLEDRFKSVRAPPSRSSPTKLRNGYIGWSPRADGMLNNARIVPKLAEGWALEPQEEIIDFYFEQKTQAAPCAQCEGSGLTPAAREIESELRQRLQSPGGLDRLTRAERAILGERSPAFASLPIIGSSELHILVCYHAERERLRHQCLACDGEGGLESGEPWLALNLWAIDPPRGGSYGILVERVESEEIPSVLETLSGHAETLLARFRSVPASEVKIPYRIVGDAC